MSGPIPDLVGRVVVRSAADTPAVRLEARSRVGRLQLRSPGRSRHEILIVRSLRLEDRGLDDQLARARSVAVPLDGRPVPSGAGSVVAADLAQLLAQFAADLHDGALTRRWWWQMVCGRLPRAPVAGVLATCPQEAPHVVADLVRRGRTDVLGSVSPAAAHDLLTRMAQDYAAPRLAEVLRRAANAGPTRRSEGFSTGGRAAPVLSGQDLLVLVATRLSQDLQDVRSAEFARFVEVAAGLSERAEPLRAGPRMRSSSDLVEPSGGSPARREQPGVTSDQSQLGRQSPDDVNATATVGSASMERAVGDSGDRRGCGDGACADARMAVHMTAEASRSLPAEATSAPTAARPVATNADAPAPGELVTELVTGLGGVFFLVHTLEDLEPPGGIIDAVGAWGVLDLVARRLVRSRPELRDDEIWAGLAALGGGPLADRAARLPAPTVVRWLDRSVPRLTRLLAEHLDIESEAVVDALLVRPARVTWDRTHVDVALPLAAASVAVRRAGLDRDPGWVPWLARVVAFHFDDLQFAGGSM